MLMPPEDVRVIALPIYHPWMVKFRMAAIFHAAERMRHLPFVLWNGVNGCWDDLNVEVIEATYTRALGVSVQSWDYIYDGRYEIVYHRMKGVVRRETVREIFLSFHDPHIDNPGKMAILNERARQQDSILFGVNPRTITPTPPSSESGSSESSHSVVSGYDPTSDMDISPGHLSY